MASISRYQGVKGPYWRVDYSRPDGTGTTRRFKKAADARDFALTVEHDKRSGTYVDPAGPRTPFAEVAEAWMASAAHKDTTARLVESVMRLHILPVLGGMRLGQITTLELRKLLRHLEAKGLSPGTVTRAFSYVTSVFSVAVETRLLIVNPAARLGPGRPARGLLVPLEDHQVAALLAELPDHYRTPALVAAEAGLRLGEVFGLTGPRVAFLARQPVIHVERQLITMTAGAAYLRLPKGDKVRAVPVGRTTVEALAEHLARYPTGVEVPDRVSGGTGRLVFATKDGTPVRGGQASQTWRRAAARAGLPGARFHDLRHYYAATLIDAGRSEREVGVRLGHSSTEVTARYGHLFQRADDQTRSAVEAAAARRRQIAVEPVKARQNRVRPLPATRKSAGQPPKVGSGRVSPAYPSPGSAATPDDQPKHALTSQNTRKPDPPV